MTIALPPMSAGAPGRAGLHLPLGEGGDNTAPRTRTGPPEATAAQGGEGACAVSVFLTIQFGQNSICVGSKLDLFCPSPRPKGKVCGGVALVVSLFLLLALLT